MKMKKIMLVTLLLLAVLTISAVSAEDNLTDSNDEVLQDTSLEEIEIMDDVISSSEDEILETDAGTFTALQEKINNAAEGSTITLQNDYTYNDGFDTTGIEISKPLTINGNGHAINALSKSRIFKITYENNGDVVLNNIKFNNGYSDESGGAIFVQPDYYFAGLYTVVSLTVNNCVFTNNAAVNGGAIHGYGLTIAYTTFNDNTASTNGGSLYIKDNSKLTNCNFNNNVASYRGGAIYMNSNDGDRSWTLTNCIFTTNNSPNGGAIYSSEELTITSCKFNSNTGGIGGALVSSGCPLYVKNSNFNQNHASNNGGAIYFYGLSKITSNGYTKVYIYDNMIQDSTFEGNVADEYGGAIYSDMTYDGKSYGMNITKCTFINNKGSSDNGVVGSIPKNCVFKTSSSSSSSTNSGSSSSGSSSTTTKTTPKLTASAKTFKVKTKTKKYVATLKTNKNKVIKNVKLTLKVNGKTYSATTNSNGKATFKITKLKKKGTFTAKITYKGNTNYNKVTKTVKIKVK